MTEHTHTVTSTTVTCNQKGTCQLQIKQQIELDAKNAPKRTRTRKKVNG